MKHLLLKMVPFWAKFPFKFIKNLKEKDYKELGPACYLNGVVLLCTCSPMFAPEIIKLDIINTRPSKDVRGKKNYVNLPGGMADVKEDENGDIADV